MLSEPQIQRYARQILLHDVGERGQEALGAVRVELALDGDATRAAAAYLRAGGTPVDVPEGPPGPWARYAAAARVDAAGRAPGHRRAGPARARGTGAGQTPGRARPLVDRRGRLPDLPP